jgi:phosphoribosylformimino-5-aminoimidazole carboxamide ribonucleotide (ProFAR) isomerase
VRRASCPVQAGGGLRSMDDVREVLAAGANRAVLGTIALEDRAELRRVCSTFGERIAVSLDAKGGELAAHGWTVGSGVPVPEAVRTFEDAGVSMFVYTDVSRDGTMSGPDISGLQRLLESTSSRIVASGGISSLADLRTVARLHHAGVEGAIVGRALYENKFGIFEAQHVADAIAAGRDDEPLIESP